MHQIKRNSIAQIRAINRRQTLASGGNNLVALYDNLSTIFDQEPPSIRVGITNLKSI